jgi:hypothetical protein
MLLGWLDLYRDTMVMKIEGLSEEQARFTPTARSNSLLNLIVHLTGVEKRWFGRTIAGERDVTDRDSELGDLDVLVADAVTAYRTQWNVSNEIARGVASLDEICKGEAGYSVRWVLHHLLEETARHAGHADITRELIDGEVGWSRDDRG